jgi:hypothetical protein
MPALQAYCGHCNRWFPSAIGLVDNAQNVTVTNFNMQCGRCGGIAPVYNGVYNAIGDTIEIVKSNDLNAQELRALTQILQRAIRENTPAGQIRNLIEKEVPKARGLNKFLQEQPNLIPILVLLISILVALTRK